MASETSSQQTRYDPWISQQQQNTAGTAYGLSNNFWQASPFARAAQTADQLKAFDFARISTGNVFDAPRQNVLDLEGARPLYTPQLSGAPASMSPSSVASGGDMQAAFAGYTPGVTASQAGPGAISAAMSPFLSGVVDSTMRNLRRERDRSASEIGARAAAAGSFGGSREAIQRGQLDRNMMETAGSTVASLMGAGYDKATATALANAQLRQQADTGNADRSQQTTLANANFQQDAGRTNYQGDLQRALTNAQLEQQASMQNANFAQTSAFKNMDAINTMRSGALDYSLKAPQVQSQLDTQRQARELQGAQAVLGAGNQQQQFAQGNFDTNRAMLDWYKQYIPQVYNQDVFKQTEKDDGGSGLLNGVLGIGSSLIGAAGKAGGFGALLGISSDETGKTDITKLGKDPETGVEMYAYRYKDDPKTYPKVVGPMAQELERDHPGTTRKIGGKMVVDVGLLSDALRSVKKAA